MPGHPASQPEARDNPFSSIYRNGVPFDVATGLAVPQLRQPWAGAVKAG